ncbi:MAG: choline dehydrogenase [Rhodospirillaceae bacterium]|nr:choline dehydrogenase [Rhodospirillaceae bacterium]|tara:strand:+ start:298 stop:1935 length:1638 start_codon:yes stop_codon:yes gene_type:complete
MAESFGSYDYIIAGAGTAGCVLANRLSADPNVSVLLLEAGGKDDYIWTKIPVGYLYCIGNPKVDWGFKTEPEPGLNGRAIDYPRGKVLGGCSSINGMIYMRGQARDYDHWAQLGNPGWGWDDVLPYFLKSEDNLALEPSDLHARGGEWRIEKPRISWEILDAFMEAAVQSGLPKVEDFNTGNNEGVGYFHVNQKRGWRWNTSRGFLKPIENRQNLRVVTGAHTKKVLIKDAKATGIVFDIKGAEQTAEVKGEIILAAGAVASPTILQLSGIGPGDALREHGIAVEHELAGVGSNLQDHLQIRCAYKVEGVETLNERANSLIGKMGIGLEYFLFQRGPMTMAPSQLGAFAKSDPSYDTPNIQYHVQPLTLDKFGEPLHTFPAFTASVCNLRPESRGTIRLKSADPYDSPSIRPNYLSAERDKQVAAQAVRYTRNIVNQPALAKYKPQEFKPGLELETQEDLVKAAGDISSTIFHPIGTCKMGDDPMAVVDGRLRVHGLRGLRVVDASIMPTITSGNTNSPTLMIAEKASEMIKADRLQQPTASAAE